MIDGVLVSSVACSINHSSKILVVLILVIL